MREPEGDAPRRVAVTRAAEDAAVLSDALRAEGLEPFEAPLLHFAFVEDGAIAARLAGEPAYDWLVCTSRHAVEAVGRALRQAGAIAASSIASARVAAVGPATADAFRALGMTPAIVPASADAVHLARSLLDGGATRGTRVLFPKARDARPELPALLRAHGVEVDEVVGYDTVPSADGAQRLTDALRAGTVVVVTLASGSAARAFATLVAADARARARLVSIGPTTTTVAHSCGLAIAGEAEEASLAALSRAAHRLVHDTFSHA